MTILLCIRTAAFFYLFIFTLPQQPVYPGSAIAKGRRRLPYEAHQNCTVDAEGPRTLGTSMAGFLAQHGTEIGSAKLSGK